MKWLSPLLRRRIYADHAAVTPVHPKVSRVVSKVEKQAFANPSSLHKDAVFAKSILADSKKMIAQVLKAHSDEIVFTGSGTEANNLALIGIVESARIELDKQYKDLHVVVSQIEHSSVLETARHLEQKGVMVDYAPVSPEGVIDEDALKKLLKPNTVLVSVMMVNNETGAIQPIRSIAKLIRWSRKHITGHDVYPYLHTDACQAPLYLDISTDTLGADLITLDAHKMRGPRGIGLLWIRRGVLISPLIHGGKQERGLRSGTENIPGITGFAKSFELVDVTATSRKVYELSNYFINQVLAEISGAHLNSPKKEENRSPHIVSFYFEKVSGEFLVLQLDAKGISCSTKSSCLRDEDESYVLRAMGHDATRAANSVRFSFGPDTSKADIRKIVVKLKESVAKQRAFLL